MSKVTPVYRRQALKPKGKQSPCFSIAYIQACQFYQIPILNHILSPSLESHKHLYLNTDKLLKDSEWQPIMNALEGAKDLKHLYVFSNSPPDQMEVGHRYIRLTIDL
jgi:hypothetical protein